MSSIGRYDNEFVLIKCCNYCVFLTRSHYEFLVIFNYAYESSKTWGDFWNILGENSRKLLLPHLEFDDCRPEYGDLIEDLKHELWIFQDEEFPGAQCIEETTTVHGSVFPNEHRIYSIKTEYGSFIDIYSLQEIDNIVKIVRGKGYVLDVVDITFPLVLRDYS